MERPTDAVDVSLLQRMLPDACGVVVYVRAAAPPWELRSVAGDGPGVLGVPTQALHEVWAELIHPEDQACVAEALSAIGPADRTSVDYRVRTAQGGERWVRDSVQRVLVPGGSDIAVGVLRDVSVERTLRAQIAALEERIWQSQRVDSLGYLATGIAHDLGNLLTAILAAVQVIEETPDVPRPVIEDLAVARESARRGSDFVKQILRFAAREQYSPGPVDLNGVLEDLRIILARSLGADVRLVLVKDPILPRIHCDPGQLEQVLLNLAVNAREAMPSGGQLTITTRLERVTSEIPVQGAMLQAGEYVLLSVADTGRGIPSQVSRRIFEPFFSTKARKGSSSGFGLSTVQRIVSAHGGGVRVESAEDEGTTFHIYLPVRTVPPRLAEFEAARASEGAASQGRVLVAEPDDSVRVVMKRVLAREGFSVMAVASALDGLRLFDRVRPPFDLVVSELLLPDRSGVELIRTLRNRLADLPVVYLRGHCDVGVLGDGDPLAVQLDKPFTPPQLLAAVKQALSGRSSRLARLDLSRGA